MEQEISSEKVKPKDLYKIFIKRWIFAEIVISLPLLNFFMILE